MIDLIEDDALAAVSEVGGEILERIGCKEFDKNDLLDHEANLESWSESSR